MTTSSNARQKAIVMMILCAVGWSLSGILIKLIDWNPFVIAGFRSLFAAITTAVFLVATKTKFIVNKKTIFGGIMMAFVFFLFVIANKMTTAANAIVLQYTEPIFLMIFSAIFLKQKFRRHDVIAAFVTLLGITLFFLDELSPGSLLGNVLAVLAGVALAFFFMTVGTSDPDEKTSSLLLGHLITAVIGILFLIWYPITNLTAGSVLNIVIQGIVQLGIPYILFTLASRHCPVFYCSLIAMIEPILNPVWVFLFVGELPGIFALVGGVIVIASVTVYCTYDNLLTTKQKKQSVA